MRQLFILCVGITVVSGVLIGNGRGYAGGSSSSSSEEHGHGHGRPPRPPGPRPPRPPRPPPTPQCPSDWMRFQRPHGVWCVKVFYQMANQVTAEALCQSRGATLSGLQNANERMQIANQGRILNAQNGGGLSEVWIGAKRRARCPTKPSCWPDDTFEWTDGHTVGTAGFHWAPQEPSNYGFQPCLELHISVADGVAARYGYAHGDLDDQYCPEVLKMYACGKVPV
ncbi:hypothetical protein CAEBREN_22396 [Caenorhabditis brenneri]|uniref:C-type lectin domain-containing protein n=1 Tax=Caenorhabditis brenneri TaxID=135651 RepID=G0P6I0_CAEBE|nr:hypothetical protein CAEBREN_22396 [Caenorhabditis brenneri]